MTPVIDPDSDLWVHLTRPPWWLGTPSPNPNDYTPVLLIVDVILSITHTHMHYSTVS